MYHHYLILIILTNIINIVAITINATIILDSENTTINNLDKIVTLNRETMKSVNVTLRDIYRKRFENANRIIEEMKPIANVTITSPLSVQRCTTKGTWMNDYERSLALTHFLLWRDFSYFDDDYDKFFAYLKLVQTKNKPLKTKKWNNTLDTFSYLNNTKMKNDVPFDGNDILLVFEDDAEVAILNFAELLKNELNWMKGNSFLFLGYCDYKITKPMPICTHAYAITRDAAKVLTQHFDSCGLPVDIQIAIMCKNNRITCTKVNMKGVKHNNKYPRKGDKSWGYVHQADIWGLFLSS